MRAGKVEAAAAEERATVEKRRIPWRRERV
jgi:hypothetical protein